MGKIVVIGADVQKKLNELSKKLQDMTPVFKDIADLELSQTLLRFEAEQDPQGGDWPDPITLRRESTGVRSPGQGNPWDYVVASNYHATPPGYRFFNRALGDKALRDTGTLFNSIGRAYGKDFAVVGTNLGYAESIQEGRFPFIGINKKTTKNIQTALNTYFKGIGK